MQGFAGGRPGTCRLDGTTYCGVEGYCAVEGGKCFPVCRLRIERSYISRDMLSDWKSRTVRLSRARGLNIS